MDLLARIAARRRGEHKQRAWPVGKGEIIAPDMAYGHDQSEFSPEDYGSYIATSNDIYSVITARARMLSRLRLQFFHGNGSDKLEDTTHPAVQQYRKVNPFWTAPRLARMDELCMGLWGQTAWALEPGPGRGKPGEIWWLKPSRLKPVTHETEYIQRYAYHSLTGEIIFFDPEEIVWQRYPNPIDEFAPLAPLAAARLAADTSQAMMQSNRQLFKNGMQIAGLIVPPADKVTFSQEQAEDLERKLERRLTGVDKAHRWAVLRYEAQFKQLAITPKDAEFVAGMGLSFRQVCRVYGMPAALLGEMDGATLSNVRDLERSAWDNTLTSDAEFRAAEIEEQYLPRFKGGAPDHCAYDFTKVSALQESATESWTREAQAIDRGAITINEWRKGKGMPPVAWGDQPYMPVNKAPVGDDGQLQLPPSTGGTPPDDEVNPANQPAQVTGEKMLDHLAARRLLAAFQVNGARL
jgi:HK97 family phage portal protein